MPCDICSRLNISCTFNGKAPDLVTKGGQFCTLYKTNVDHDPDEMIPDSTTWGELVTSSIHPSEVFELAPAPSPHRSDLPAGNSLTLAEAQFDSGADFLDGAWFGSELVIPGYNPIATSLMPGPASAQTRLIFLARMTCTNGLANTFDCGNSFQRRYIMSALIAEHDFSSTKKIAGEVAPAAPSSRGGQSSSFTSQHSRIERHGASNRTSRERASFDLVQHPLELKSRDIVLGIREAVYDTPRRSRAAVNWSPKVEALCSLFFSPENLERFILAFWSIFYPNWPVFHRPTFSAAKKPATLLAAMALIGATMTSEKNDRDQAMRWADAVHCFVFSDPQLSDEPIAAHGSDIDHLEPLARLDAIRAAFAMLLWMTWEGSPAQQKKARRQDFYQVVAAARSLQHHGAVHDNLGTYCAAARQDDAWKAFILREELLRTLAYVFLLDCAFVIFNNCTPRMLVSELQIDLACPEVCFQAADAGTWSQHMIIWAQSTIGQTRPSLAGVTTMMMQDGLSQEKKKMLRQMNTLNFFVVISGK